MNKESLPEGLYVSCQALSNEPLHSSFIMGRMAIAALEGGAVGIRANSLEDIKEIKKNVSLPLIGIVKRDYEGSDVFITATKKEVDEVALSGAEIIAIDATDRKRPNGETLEGLLEYIHETYPKLLVMADCSTIVEVRDADKLGFDIVSPTLLGYTAKSKDLKIETNDFEVIKQMQKEVKNATIFIEGNINTPKKLKRVLELGVKYVVIGSAITRPQLITKTFTDVIKDMKK